MQDQACICVPKKRAGFCPPGLGMSIPPGPPWGGWSRGAPGRPAARGRAFVPWPWVFKGFPADLTHLTLCRWIYLQMVFKPNTFKTPSAWSILGGGARSQGWGMHPTRDEGCIPAGMLLHRQHGLVQLRAQGLAGGAGCQQRRAPRPGTRLFGETIFPVSVQG